MVAGTALWHMFLNRCLQRWGRPITAFTSFPILTEASPSFNCHITPARYLAPVLPKRTLAVRTRNKKHIYDSIGHGLSLGRSTRNQRVYSSQDDLPNTKLEPGKEFEDTREAAGRVRSAFPQTYGLSPGQYRRALRREKYNKRLRNNKQFKNSLLKAKGSWSYDWRVALEILRHNVSSSGDAQPNTSRSNSEEMRESPAISMKHNHNQKQLETGRVPPKEASNRKQRTAAYRSTWFVTSDGTNVRLQGREAWMKKNSLNFLKTVRELTGRSTPRMLQRFRYKSTSPLSPFHSKDAEKNHIRHQIISIFEDQGNRPLLSYAAFYTAISYFCRQNLLRDARSFLNLMDEVKITPDRKVYNIFLRAASTVKDLGNFTSILRAMVGRNIQPDLNTWLSFIFALESDVVKIKVASLMLELGMVRDEWVLQKLAMSQVEIALHNHIKSKGLFQDFLSKLDTQYGHRWLTLRSGSMICHRLCGSGLSSDAEKMLKVMSQRHILPNNSTLSAFLTLSFESRDRRHALYYLELFQRDYGILPESEHEFSLLFRLGWQTRSYNVCRLVWTVACAKSKVSNAVQRAVFRSLTNNFPTDTGLPGQRWLREAGKIILGHGFVPEGNKMDFEMFDRNLIIRQVSDGLRPGQFNHEVHTLARQVFTEDITASGRYYYQGDFVEDFRRAVEQDKGVPWEALAHQHIAVKIGNMINPRFSRRSATEKRTYVPRSLFEEAQASLDGLEKRKNTNSHSTNPIPRLFSKARF